MASFSFELVSPTRLVFSGNVEQVDVPGAEGDFGVFAGHAPLIAALRPGILTVRAGGNVKRLYVRDGFAEVSPAGLTVIAELAAPAEELSADALAQEVQAAETALAASKDGPARDRAAERVGQLKHLAGQLAGATAGVH